jgi:thiamine pyrophosphate-dependent acetolactate synthase large subunit-like protein
VLALTGQVDTQVLGPGAFQEVDLGAAFGKVARFTRASRSSRSTPSRCSSASFTP